VYTGKMNWSKYAVNEMATLIMPARISNSAAIELYHQWTVDNQGVKQKSGLIQASLRDCVTTELETKGTFGPGYYTYEVSVPNDLPKATIRMSNPSGASSSNTLDRRGMGTKKVNRRYAPRIRLV
jgi:hypothetical protein